MENNYLIKMMDGGLKDISDDSWCESEGCKTCEWGSEYVNEFTLELEGFNLEVEISDMYEYPKYSQEDLMKMLCRNTDIIQSMTQDEFIKFVKDSVMEVRRKNGFEYEPTFKKIEKI